MTILGIPTSQFNRPPDTEYGVMFFGNSREMNNKNLLVLKFISVAISILALASFSFFANEARKEIYYLCGNFKPNMIYADITRQLDTANLSGYTIETIDSGKLVRHSSSLHFHLLRCNMNFNTEDVLLSANYD